MTSTAPSTHGRHMGQMIVYFLRLCVPVCVIRGRPGYACAHAFGGDVDGVPEPERAYSWGCICGPRETVCAGVLVGVCVCPACRADRADYYCVLSARLLRSSPCTDGITVWLWELGRGAVRTNEESGR